MSELITLATQYGAHGILLLTVYIQWKVIVYLNGKREEERKASDERYISMIREQGQTLLKIADHLDEAKHE